MRLTNRSETFPAMAMSRIVATSPVSIFRRQPQAQAKARNTCGSWVRGSALSMLAGGRMRGRPLRRLMVSGIKTRMVSGAPVMQWPAGAWRDHFADDRAKPFGSDIDCNAFSRHTDPLNHEVYDPRLLGGEQPVPQPSKSLSAEITSRSFSSGACCRTAAMVRATISGVRTRVLNLLDHGGFDDTGRQTLRARGRIRITASDHVHRA